MASFTLFYDVYSTGITYDNHQSIDDLDMFTVEAGGLA